MQRNGTYLLEDLCKGLTCKIELQYDDTPAYVTRSGFLPDSDDFTTSTGLPEGEWQSEWEMNEAGARWFIGAQLGWDFAIQQLGFAPHQATINHGELAGFVGGVNGGRSVTTCNMQASLSAVLAAFNPPAGLLASGALDADIIGVSGGAFSPGKASWSGVVLHEYGHFAFCEGLDRFGGFAAKEAYMGQLMKSLISHPTDTDKQQIAPVRNSAEAWADLFSYRAIGYTDYVQTSPGSEGLSGGSLCATNPDPTTATSGSVCVEPDGKYSLPGDPGLSTAWDRVLGSRLSVAADWIDTPTFDDDGLKIGMDVVLAAATSGSSDIRTETIGATLTGPVWQYSAEDMCAVYLRHGWPCSSLSGGFALDAPTNFDGVAQTPSSIAWSWSPTSTLATSYTVVSLQDGSWVDRHTTDAQGFSSVQAVLDVAGNTPITAAVEARRDGSESARSVKVTRCTGTKQVEVGMATSTPTGVVVEWEAPRASQFRIRRRTVGAGAFAPVATVPATGKVQQTFLDSGAPPGVDVEYVVDSINCDGVIRESTTAIPAHPGVPDDPTVVYVRAGFAGGVGTRLLPVGTLNEGLALLTATRNRMAVTTGSYPERLDFDTVPADVGEITLFGGYNLAFDKRDPAAWETRLVGTDSFTGPTEGGGEFIRRFNPLLVSRHHDARLDGIVFAPGDQLCTPTCHELTLFYGQKLTVVDSKLLPSAGVLTYGGNGPMVRATECVFENTTVEGAAAPTRTLVDCDQASVNRSELFAGPGGVGIAAKDAYVTGSVVRGDGAAWSPGPASPSIGITASHCLLVRSSLVAGSAAIHSAEDPDAGCSQDRSGVFRSLVYGDVRLTRVRVANNVFIGERSPQLDITLPGICVGSCVAGISTGNIMRNNLFVVPGPTTPDKALVATTVYRDTNAQGPLLGADVNDASAWFGPFANDVAENRVVTSLAGVFDTTVLGPSGPVELDPTWRGNRGHVFHFDPAFKGHFGTPLSVYGQPQGLSLDGDLPLLSSVGPYR
jgi:hypothetical protein